MTELLLTVDDSGFREWIHEVELRYRLMIRTMSNIAEIIRLNTIPLVPLDTGELETSFEYMIMENSPFIKMTYGFDAVDEESGFHYAEYQHNTILQHPKRGAPFYLTKGIYKSKGEVFSLIEKDYYSLFNGRITSGSIGKNNHAKFIKYVNM